MQMGYSPRMRCIPRVFTAQSSSNRHEQAKRLPARDFCFKFMSPPYLQCNFDSVTSSVCRTSFSSRILKPVCTDHCSGAKEKNCLSTLCNNTRWKKVRKVITRRGLMRERENSDDRHSQQSCWLLQKCHFKNFVSVCSEPKQESLKSNPD